MLIKICTLSTGSAILIWILFNYNGTIEKGLKIDRSKLMYPVFTNNLKIIIFDGCLFQDLIHDLQIAKRQTWEEKERLSAQYEEERKTNLANRVNSFHFT